MALYELKDVFFDPIARELQAASKEGLRTLCLVTDTAGDEAPRLSQEGWKTDVVGEPGEIKGRFDAILVPTHFLSAEKERASEDALRVAKALKSSGLAAVLFPPAWFPAAWKPLASHHHIEQGHYMIVRSGKEVRRFTLLTNREIYAIFDALTPRRLTTLQNGMRRALFTK